MLLRFHDLVLDRRDEILDLMQLEAGKARRHAFEEIVDVAITARYYARRGPRFLRSRRRRGLIPFLTRVTEHRHPIGVVGIISPWNYPLTLAVCDALPALLAGNAIVLKPAEKTSLLARFAVDLLVEAGLPGDLFQVVTGSGEVAGAALVDAADAIAFTGSTEVGRRIAARAGERLIHVSLELGGKNPLIVLADADLDRAAEGAVRACFTNAGQLCIAAERLYVQSALYDRFLDAFVARTRAMRIAADFSFDTDMGSLVGPEQLAKVTAHVADAVAKGAQVLAGGRARPDIGPYFFEPTILDQGDAGHAGRARRDFRSGRRGQPLRRRRGSDPARQRERLWPQRQHLVARHADAPRKSGRGSRPAPSISTRPMARRGRPSTRRSAATRLPGSGAGTAAKASSASPRARPSRPRA